MTRRRTIPEMMELTARILFGAAVVGLLMWACRPEIPAKVDTEALYREAQRRAQCPIGY